MIQKTVFMRHQSRCFFNHFPKNHIKSLLGKSDAKLGIEYFQTDNWE